MREICVGGFFHLFFSQWILNILDKKNHINDRIGILTKVVLKKCKWNNVDGQWEEHGEDHQPVPGAHSQPHHQQFGQYQRRECDGHHMDKLLLKQQECSIHNDTTCRIHEQFSSGLWRSYNYCSLIIVKFQGWGWLYENIINKSLTQLLKSFSYSSVDWLTSAVYSKGCRKNDEVLAFKTL